MNAADRTFSINENQFREMLEVVTKDFSALLLNAQCRRALAMARWTKSGKQLRIFESPASGVMPGTVEHNRREIDANLFGSAERTQRLLGPLSAIDPVFGNAGKLTALSIGPRTEMELLHLIGIGFKVQNVRAVDLIASSPLMDLGDMHDLPYKDRSFHVVISGWVLTYSKDPERAVREMVRVCADGGLLAIGVSSSPDYPGGYRAQPKDAKEIVGSMFRRASDLAAMIGPSLDKICFQHDPIADDVTAPVLLIARIRHK